MEQGVSLGLQGCAVGNGFAPLPFAAGLNMSGLVFAPAWGLEVRAAEALAAGLISAGRVGGVCVSLPQAWAAEVS